MALATLIIGAKLKNQFYLIKYFHKYHKLCYQELADKYTDITQFNQHLKDFLRCPNYTENDFLTLLIGHESQGAIKYPICQTQNRNL